MGEHEAPHRAADRLDRGGERLPLRAHHQRVDHRDAVIVDDAPALLTPDSPPGLDPHEHAVGELVQRVGWDGGHIRSWRYAPGRWAPLAAPTTVGPFRTLAQGRHYAFRMSERSRHLPRRSCLSVPGSSEKMLGKAPGLGADMVFLDLEDAVAPLEKPAARAKVVNAINTLDFGESVLCVRVNDWDTEWTYRDVIEVVENASERLDELMLPKVETAADVTRSITCSRRSRRPPAASRASGSRLRSRPRVGSSTSRRSARRATRLETIVLGPVDMSASMEMPVARRRA